MIQFVSILLAVVLALSTGCSSLNCAKALSRSPWEQGTKAHLESFRHVLVVCVYDFRCEDRGPGGKPLYHHKAIVTRSYRGDWSVSEPIAFVTQSEGPCSTVNQPFAYLRVILTNKHTDTEIALDTDESFNYLEDDARIFQCVFPYWVDHERIKAPGG